jgi:hypothetical protein
MDSIPLQRKVRADFCDAEDDFYLQAVMSKNLRKGRILPSEAGGAA